MILLRKEFAKRSRKINKIDREIEKRRDEDFYKDVKGIRKNAKSLKRFNKGALAGTLGVLGGSFGAGLGQNLVKKAPKRGTAWGAGIGAAAGIGAGLDLGHWANKPVKKLEKEIDNLEEGYRNARTSKEKKYYKERYRDLITGVNQPD